MRDNPEHGEWQLLGQSVGYCWSNCLLCQIRHVQWNASNQMLWVLLQVKSLSDLEATLVRNLTDHFGNNLIHTICIHDHDFLLPWITEKFGQELLSEALADENRKGQTPVVASIKVLLFVQTRLNTRAVILWTHIFVLPLFGNDTTRQFFKWFYSIFPSNRSIFKLHVTDIYKSWGFQQCIAWSIKVAKNMSTCCLFHEK